MSYILIADDNPDITSILSLYAEKEGTISQQKKVVLHKWMEWKQGIVDISIERIGDIYVYASWKQYRN